MIYYLVDPTVLRANGINSFDTMPDGRAIIDGSTLKALGRVSVEVIPNALEVKELREKQIQKLKEENK